jgi:hypothetical protein
MELTALERAVLEKLFAGDHPSFPALRAQLHAVRVLERTLSGGSYFADLQVPDEIAPARIGKDAAWFGDVEADFDGLEHGATFVVRIAEGRLEMLEGSTVDEPWPAEGTPFRLRYAADARRLDPLD